MALRATPTIAICLVAGVAAGVALARPGSDPAPAAAPVAAETATTLADSPYLADGVDPANADQGGAAQAEAPAAAPPAAISIQDFAFAGTAQAAAGSAVAVTNFDSAPHTLTARNGEFDTGNLGEGDQATITLPTTPGTYEFFCAIHPSMTGQIVVG